MTIDLYYVLIGLAAVGWLLCVVLLFGLRRQSNDLRTARSGLQQCAEAFSRVAAAAEATKAEAVGGTALVTRAPPLDIAWIWHVHRLAPVAYALLGTSHEGSVGTGGLVALLAGVQLKALWPDDVALRTAHVAARATPDRLCLGRVHASRRSASAASRFSTPAEESLLRWRRSPSSWASCLR